MQPALVSALRSPRFAPLSASAEAVLRLLSDGTPNWSQVAMVAGRDAAFTYALLSAAPLRKEDLGQELPLLLAPRLEQLGADVLRAWLLGTDDVPHARHKEAILSHGLMTAECALHLAIETGYPRPQDAYLAGLLHDLGRLALLDSASDYADYSSSFSAEHALAVEERKRHGHDHGALSGELAAACGAPLQLVDAIVLHHALEEHASAAHPLTRILWAAEALASDEHDDHLDAISRISGLAESTLLSLRTDVAFIAGTSPGAAGAGLRTPSSPAPIPSPDWNTSGTTDLPTNPGQFTSPAPPATVSPINDYWRRIAIQGLLRSAFTGLPDELVRLRLAMANRLLFGRPQPLIVSVEPTGQLAPVPGTGQADVCGLVDELQLRLDDEASVVALAARTGATTSHFPGPHGPGRSPRDWHLARWLAAPGLWCLPCRNGQEHYVAIFGIDEYLDNAHPEQALMATLAASAATALLEKSRRAATEAALRASIEQRYREHARRIVHEANNPLTVIRSYLGLIGQRLDENHGMQGELHILNQELDRVGALLKSVTQAPLPVQAEPPVSPIGDILQELRTLYAGPLFTQRNIEFDVRPLPGLPPAHIPPSVLKQVLLNLLRNASEALLDGGKLSVSTAGPLIVDGVASLEIRLIDNGPGIPPERLVRLFESQPSDKPGHQGVGLSICRELLSQWHALIVCRSQPGSGTSFQIFIPLDQRT